LQRYIRYARTLNPVLTKECKTVLVECYRLLRQNDILGKNKTAYRITVRQLESLVRLSEALARLHLDDQVQPVYVREAYRLLQKSIIFVETEDIELDDNEDEMNRINSSLNVHEEDDKDKSDYGDINALGNDVDDTGASSGADRAHYIDTENYEDVEAAKRTVEKIISETNNRDVEPRGEIESMKRLRDVSDDDRRHENEGTVRKEKKTKKKTQISAEKYRQITGMITLFMKQQESSPKYRGTKWGDLMAWYLKQFSAELRDLGAFNEHKKLVNQVIKRMIKHEGALIEVEEIDFAENNEQDKNANDPDSIKLNSDSNENKLLKLHPSYDTGNVM